MTAPLNGHDDNGPRFCNVACHLFSVVASGSSSSLFLSADDPFLLFSLLPPADDLSSPPPRPRRGGGGGAEAAVDSVFLQIPSHSSSPPRQLQQNRIRHRVRRDVRGVG